MEAGFDTLDRRRGGEESREYDDDRNVITLWLTDSDDEQASATAHANAVTGTARASNRRNSRQKPTLEPNSNMDSAARSRCTT